jgi:hypothetical protein
MREAHPFAALVPSMSEAEYAELLASIHSNGYLGSSVTLHRDGRTLDGRHRERACGELGIDAPTTTFNGTDREAIDFVIAMNLNRRHLNETQRAMVAAKLPGLMHGGDRRSDQAATLPVVTQATKARAFNVSERSVRDAAVVRERAIPEIVQACEQGGLPVSQAALVARLPDARQRQVAADLGDGRSTSTIVLGATRAERAAVIERQSLARPLSLLARTFPALWRRAMG